MSNNIDYDRLSALNLELKRRENELNSREEHLKKVQNELSAKEKQLIIRENEVKSKNDVLHKRQLDLDNKEFSLNSKENDIAIGNKEIEERKAFLFNQDKSLKEKEQKITDKIQEYNKKLIKYHEDIAKFNAQQSSLQKKQEELIERETKVISIENAVKEEELKLQKEKNQQLQVLTQDKLELLKKIDEEQHEKYIEAMKKFEEERHKKYIESMDDLKNKFEKNTEDKLRELEEREKKLSKDIEVYENDRLKLEKEKERLLVREEKFKEREESVNDREDELEEELKEKLDSLCKEDRETHKEELNRKETIIEDLRKKNSELSDELKSFGSFREIYGDTREIIENKIKNLQEENKILKEKLLNSPSVELKDDYERLKEKSEEQRHTIDELSKENENFLAQNEQFERLQIEKNSLEGTKQSLETEIKELEARCTKYEGIIERLSSPEARLADRDERIKAINTGYLKPIPNNLLPDIYGKQELFEAFMKLDKKVRKVELEKYFVNEVPWLENIYDNCNEYGIHFPKRILYAFHTALKISDWASITVLAGVSGTGKSELPKLYATFGGMNFISVPVQPSWDSQESMLGFFNSIDNRFEPEPLLRFLVQCINDDSFNKYMSIVLLDEMNLAHVEHYFADFLSKLETRRSSSKKDVPNIEVKLGSGVAPYPLKLERCILWTGTMNQDETTKSLSDKVLDRGIVINFPRPTKLKSREEMAILSKFVEKSNCKMLLRENWGNWITRTNDFEGEPKKQLDKYKEIVENINKKLENMGRAVGHRVWQAIEFYILNYPTVRQYMDAEHPEVLSEELKDAMKIAFEDQIVQKVMPKLRGIETYGSSLQHLQEIGDLLVSEGFEKLQDDFKIAYEQGHGQFIWNSAKYIEQEDNDEPSQTGEFEDESEENETE